jgi:FO synthase
VKAGREGAIEALQVGVNDLGGTLMNESISRAAGAGFGQECSPEQMETLIRDAGRVPRQRTTLYAEPSPAQVARSFAAPPLEPPRNPHVNDAKLRRPARLERPVAAA